MPDRIQNLGIIHLPDASSFDSRSSETVVLVKLRNPSGCACCSRTGFQAVSKPRGCWPPPRTFFTEAFSVNGEDWCSLLARTLKEFAVVAQFDFRCNNGDDHETLGHNAAIARQTPESLGTHYRSIGTVLKQVRGMSGRKEIPKEHGFKDE